MSEKGVDKIFGNICVRCGKDTVGLLYACECALVAVQKVIPTIQPPTFYRTELQRIQNKFAWRMKSKRG